MACLIAWATGMAASPGPLPPEADKDLARDILRELVDINTTHDHGSTAAAQVIQQQLLAAGFPADDVVLVAPADKPTKGNIVVRYRGKAHGGKKGPAPVLFLGHLDVVEARREDWSTDPFQLTEKDGWFYGRGTQDMKDGDATSLSLSRPTRRQAEMPMDLLFC
jgi:acetylornithine deacetylase/succinyl-diaminopimelate desuccinylase-like protein